MIGMTIHRLPRLLDRLDQLWREQGASIAHYAAPGLTDAEIDALAASAGIVVPPELRLWWGWHNGVLEHGVEEFEASTIVTYLDLLSLETALEIRAANLALPTYPDDPVLGDWYWRESWLPVIGSGNPALYVDTNTVTEAELSPVYRFDAMWERGWNVPVTSSFTAAVATIVRVIEERCFGWSEQDSAWVVLNEDLPPDIDQRFF
jgi:hypothetical protein